MKNHLTIIKSAHFSLMLTSDLAKSLNDWAEKLIVSLREIGRKALYDFIEKLERDRIEDACKFYYEHDKKLAGEWRSAESKVTYK